MKHLAEEILDYIATTGDASAEEQHHLEECADCYSSFMALTKFNSALKNSFPEQNEITVLPSILPIIEEDKQLQEKSTDVSIFIVVFTLLFSALGYFYPTQFQFIHRVIDKLYQIPFVEANGNTIFMALASCVVMLGAESIYRKVKNSTFTLL